jgi:hypothetical protein
MRFSISVERLDDREIDSKGSNLYNSFILYDIAMLEPIHGPNPIVLRHIYTFPHFTFLVHSLRLLLHQLPIEFMRGEARVPTE